MNIQSMDITMQNEILTLTERKLKDKKVLVSYKLNPVINGTDERIWVIDDKITFTFKTYGFGQAVGSLKISMNKGQVKCDFSDKEFVENMYKLFKNRDSQVLKDSKDRQMQSFFKNFQENIK